MPISTDSTSKPFSLVHLQLIDANTGDRIEFRFLPIDMEILKKEPMRHSLDWPYPVSCPDSYIERLKQIEGATFSIRINGETQPQLTDIIVTPNKDT